MTDDATNAKIGERTRDLLQALSSFADMLAIDAPTPVLVRQLAEMEKITREIYQTAGVSFAGDIFGGIVDDPVKLMRLYELVQHRQAQAPYSE